jgi:hypothetical protein
MKRLGSPPGSFPFMRALVTSNHIDRCIEATIDLGPLSS